MKKILWKFEDDGKISTHNTRLGVRKFQISDEVQKIIKKVKKMRSCV